MLSDPFSIAQRDTVSQAAPASGALSTAALADPHTCSLACERTQNEEVIVATTQAALQISTIVPSFTVDDLQKSITFYEALGFTIDERWEDNGKLLGVMLRAGKSQIGLNQDDWKKGRDRKKGIGMRLFISTPQNVDEIAVRARDAGIQLNSEPHDTVWKNRAFEVTDPSGFLLTISSELPA
jgi:uncharacterized glyoxalase superfamily protein PhnB